MKKLIVRKSDPDFREKPEKPKYIDFEEEQKIIRKSKMQAKLDAIDF